MDYNLQVLLAKIIFVLWGFRLYIYMFGVFKNNNAFIQLVLLLFFLFNLSLFRYLIHFVGFDRMNELSDGDWFRCVVVWALQVHGAHHPHHRLQVHRGRIRKDRRQWITCPYLLLLLLYFNNCLQFCICNYSMFLGPVASNCTFRMKFKATAY